jgi:2-keto-4-pentenoate hydratase
MNADALATELLDALDRNTLLEPITARQPGFDAAAAYEVGAAILRRRQARGERSIGRKIGFTNRAVWPEYGVMWAPVYASTVTFLQGVSTSLEIGHLAQPRLEPEVVMHFGSTPPVTMDEAALLSHVDWVAHGFEIVQSHYPTWTFREADAIAGFGLHGALVVGPKRPVAQLPGLAEQLRTFTVEVARDGVVQARGGGAHVLGSPLRAVAELLALLAAGPVSEPLRAGEIVTTGTLTPLVDIRAGETWSTEISGIDLDGLLVEFR